MTKRNKVKPTILQKKTTEILVDHPEMPVSKAMVQAGYSPRSAEAPKQNFIDRAGSQVAIEQWREKLRGVGITTDFMANKHKEWITATKVKTSLTEPDQIVPDYQTQLKAGEMLRKDFGLDTTEQNIQQQQTNLQINFTPLKGNNE